MANGELAGSLGGATGPIDYEGLARRAFDEPMGRDGMAALRVWADELEAKGDPRGALIAMEHALLAEPARHRELHLAMNAHVASSASPMFGELKRLMTEPRALVLDWRAGQLYGARFETARLEKTLGLSTEALVELLVAAPVASTLRRLAIRTATDGRGMRVCQWLANAAHSPLEELAIGAELRSRRFGTAEWLYQNTRSLMARYPGLRFLTNRDFVISLPLTLDDLPPDGPRVAMMRAPATGIHLRQLRDADPSTAAGRVVIGRALANVDEALRDAALQRLAALGERAFMFADTLTALLAVAEMTRQAASALSQIGHRGWIAMRALSKISSRKKSVDAPTRKAAGRALASLNAKRCAS